MKQLLLLSFLCFSLSGNIQVTHIEELTDFSKIDRSQTPSSKLVACWEKEMMLCKTLESTRQDRPDETNKEHWLKEIRKAKELYNKKCENDLSEMIKAARLFEKND